jgi:hypothetical protein
MTDDPPRLDAYALEDQFGRARTRADVADRVALYVVAERGGAVALQQWTTALHVALHAAAAGAAPSAVVVPVVRVPGVPRLVRGAVRRLLPRDPDAWALLDWDDALGVLVEHDAECTVSVVASDGRVVHREAVRLPDEASVARLVGAASDAAPSSTGATPGTRPR